MREEQYTEFLQDDFKRHNCETLEDFYASIGYGGVMLSKIIPRLKDKYEKLYEKELELYLKGGFMKKTARGYAFTVKGMFVSNYILSDMLDFDSDIIRGMADGSDKV